MLRRKVFVRDVHGLRLRPAARIVNACRGIDSTVTICKGRENADCKSIWELLLLDAGSGSRLEIVTEGQEEELAMRKVMEIF